MNSATNYVLMILLCIHSFDCTYVPIYVIVSFVSFAYTWHSFSTDGGE